MSRSQSRIRLWESGASNGRKGGRIKLQVRPRNTACIGHSKENTFPPFIALKWSWSGHVFSSGSTTLLFLYS